jgi:hypothetical protein
MAMDNSLRETLAMKSCPTSFCHTFRVVKLYQSLHTHASTDTLKHNPLNTLKNRQLLLLRDPTWGEGEREKKEQKT